MCSYNITLSDTLMEKVRPSFADDKALERWLQQQLESIVLDLYMKQERQQPADLQAAPDIVLSLLGAGMPVADDDLNGRNAYYQHLEEKHK